MYRHVDASLIRLSTHQHELNAAGWPDLAAQGSRGTRARCDWLRRVWAVDLFAGAVTQASPVLAERVEAALIASSPCPRAVHRASVSMLRYLLRATTRATPFGLFAGVAAVSVASRGDVHIGARHRVTARVDPRWLAEMVERVQGDNAVRDHLMVVVNELAVPRGDRLVLPCPHHTPTASEVSVRMGRPVVLAVQRARVPIRFTDLLAAVLDELPAARPELVEQMLTHLLAAGLLVTDLSAVLTGADPLDRVIDIVSRLDPSPGSDGATALVELRARSAHLAHARAPLRRAPASIHNDAQPSANLDVRVDAAVTIPRAVTVEAEAAAAALVRAAADDPSRAGWRDYHRRFLDRYGIGALVPVPELLHAGDGLGYPAGFRHSTLPAPRAEEQTRRTAWLVALAQTAIRHCQREVVLTDADLDRFGEMTTPQPQPHTDLRVEVHAASCEDLDRGDFRLVVIGASRAAGTVTGRFLDLLHSADQDRIIETYRRLPSATRGAERVQLRGAPLNPSAAAITYSMPVLPRHVVLGGAATETSPSRLALPDIAVSADATGLYLMSLSDGTPLEPHLFSAIELVATAHPTLRFLTEIGTSSCTPCAPFTWGQACAMLPFLPRLRYGRTVLSSARWLLTSDDLTPNGAAPDQAAPDGTAVDGGTATDPTVGVLAWQRRWEVPDLVELREHDRRLGLDMREPAHRHLLQAALHRNGRVTVAEAPEAGMLGWIEGRAHELVIALATTTVPTHPPRPRPTAALVTTTNRSTRHVPGAGTWLSAQLLCRPDQQDAVLTRHLPTLLDELGLLDEDCWWFLRHTDNGHHLRLRFKLDSPDAFGSTAARVGRWADTLVQAGSTGPLRLHTYHPERGRFGDGPLMHAAEAVFATDSAAAVAQIGLDPGELRAVTAAGMLALATGMLTADGLTWLRDHAPRIGPNRLDAALRSRVSELFARERSALTIVPGGDRVMLAWARRDAALSRYRFALAARGIAAEVVLPDLLHLHHTRVAGPDLDAERDCLRTARAVALSVLVRAGHAA